MTASVPVGTKLGRYEVVKHLATGGMADLSIARASGLAGFERHVVIKHLRPEQAQDAAFVEMFITEARLAGALHHHNIVQVHDIGEERGKHFFAMEYVHGEDVRKLLSTLSERRQQLPIPHVVMIGASVAAALHHAHEQRGSDRKPLNIVHRDVTPANIMIGYDGNVKVLDFGIAKAAMRTTETQAGMLKGKVPYMAPEQCTGKPVDRRSDVFSLGIVLYELATVRRLFKGANEFFIMSAVVSGEIPPPSRHRKDLPKELEQIILKALARRPTDRFQTAEEMRAALETFAETAGIRTSTSGLAGYMKQLFGERMEPWLVPPDEDEPITLVDFDGPVDGIVTPPPEVLEKRAIPKSVPTTRNSLIEQARLNAISSSLSPIPGARGDAPPGGPRNGANGANGARVPLPPVVARRAAVSPTADTERDINSKLLEDHRESATQSMKGPPRPINGAKPAAPRLPGLPPPSRDPVDARPASPTDPVAVERRVPTDRVPTDPVSGEISDPVMGFTITRVANPPPPPPPVIIQSSLATREPTAIVTPLPRPAAEIGDQTAFTTVASRRTWLTVGLAGLVVALGVTVVVLVVRKTEVAPTPSVASTTPTPPVVETPKLEPMSPPPDPSPPKPADPKPADPPSANTATTDAPPVDPPGTTRYRPLEPETAADPKPADTTDEPATNTPTDKPADTSTDSADTSSEKPADVKPQVVLRDPPVKPTKPKTTKPKPKPTKTTKTTKKATKPTWDPNALFLKKK